MFIIIPFILIAVSLVGLMYLILKKTPYLRKLSAENGVSVFHFWQDLFPEVAIYARKIDYETHKQEWMREFEKLVRRLHVISLKVSNFTSSLLRRIKKNGEKSRKKDLERKPVTAGLEESAVSKITIETLKEKEQDLIVQVAKDPKNVALYRELGEVYIEMGNMKDAHESLRVAHDLAPDDAHISDKLSKVEKHLHL